MQQQIKNLIAEVKEFHPKVISLTSQNSNIIKCQRLQVNTDFNNNTLYIGYVSQIQYTLQFLEGITLFLIQNDNNIHFTENYNNCIVIFPVDTDISKLLSKCIEIIDCQKRVFEDSYLLFDAFLSHKTLHEIVELAAQTIDNPIIILNNSYRVLASSKSRTSDDLQWKENISLGYCTYEFISLFNNIEDVKNTFKINTPFLSGCLASPLRRCISRLYSGKQQLGFLLSIESNSDFTDQDMQFLQLLSKLLSRIIDINHHMTKSIIYSNCDDILRDCLNGNFNNRQTFIECMSYTGFDLSSTYYICIFNIDNYNIFDLNSETLNKHITNAFPASLSVNYQNNIVVLVDKAKQKGNISKYVEKYTGFLKKYNLKVGVSDEFTDLYLLPFYHNQAKRALSISDLVDPDSVIVFFDNYKFYDLVLNNADKKHLKSYLGSTCARIIEYDKQNNTEYFLTIYYYFYYSKNLSLIGEKMYVHKNTISYRIRKIKDLFDLDLDNANTKIKVFYSFMIWQLLQSKIF